MKNESFTKEDSLVVKGIAILMMLWHHCYLAGRFDGYEINFWPFAENRVIRIAVFCKICVSLFAFVSGYGLYLSYRKKPEGRPSGGWLATRLISTLKQYWFVVVLAWITGLFIQGKTQAFYFAKGVVYGLWRMFTDLLGISIFFGDNTGIMFNGTWWYMSAAIVFVLVTPLLTDGLKRWGSLTCVATVFFLSQMGGYGGGVNALDFLLPFALGAAFAHGDWFARWYDFCAKRGILAFVLSAVAVAFCFKLNWSLPADHWWNVKYGAMPVMVILFVKEYIIPIPGIRQVLCYLGRHSANIFLVHTFIRYYYCEAITYSWGRYSFAAVIAFLLVTSLALSYGIIFLKKLTHYDAAMAKLQDALLRRIDPCAQKADTGAT